MSTRASVSAAPRRFDELDAYRGIAALGIVVFHSYQYSGGVYAGTALHPLFAGLQLSAVFFCLSGFLLFLPFARAALAQDGVPAARGFLIRRLIRLVPLYYLVLLGIWTWRFAGEPAQVVDLLLHLSFTHSFHPDYIFSTVGPAWSLAVELHFYLFLAVFGPLLHWLCGKLPTRSMRLALIATLLGLLVAGSVRFKWVIAGSAAPLTALFSLPARLDSFALGMLLALAVAEAGERPRFGLLWARLLRAAGLALVAAAALLAALSPLAQLYHASLIGLASALLIASTVLGPRGTPWERVLRAAPLRLLGTLSFGIFLLHEPLLIELGRAGLLISPAPGAFPRNALVLIGLSLVGAALGYALIERPTGELRHLFDRSGRLVERYGDAAPAAPTVPARHLSASARRTAPTRN